MSSFCSSATRLTGKVFTFTLLVFCALTVMSSLATRAQAVVVLSDQKISATEGGLLTAGEFNDKSLFGAAVADIGDVNNGGHDINRMSALIGPLTFHAVRYSIRPVDDHRCAATAFMGVVLEESERRIIYIGPGTAEMQ